METAGPSLKEKTPEEKAKDLKARDLKAREQLSTKLIVNKAKSLYSLANETDQKKMILCNSCEEGYPKAIDPLTEGECLPCTIEIICNNIGPSLKAILDANKHKESADKKAFEARPKDQQIHIIRRIKDN